MGDKHKSEPQKPINNTLLSGASHGYLFESLHGNSMLIPVSQDSPSVLNDSVNQLDEQIGGSDGSKSLSGSSSIDFNQKSSVQEESNTSSQGYAGMLNSFFGGGGRAQGAENTSRKSGSDLVSGQKENFDQFSQSFVTSADSSVSNVETFSHDLRGPQSSSIEFASSSQSNPIGFVHSSDSLFQQTQSCSSTWLQPQYSKSMESSSGDSFQKLELSPEMQASQLPDQQLAREQTKANPGFVSQSYAANIGFEAFSGRTSHPPSGLIKAHSSFDLPVDSLGRPLGSAASFCNLVQNQVITTTPSFLQQTRSESVDSFQSPSTRMPPPPFSASGSLTSAPPTSSSIPGKTYRRGLHKGVKYAQVPGLTSNTVVSSSLLVPSDNFQSYGSLTYSALTPPTSKMMLSSSLSQPSINLSSLSQNPSDSSRSTSLSVSMPSTSSASITTSSDSLQNFFPLKYNTSSSPKTCPTFTSDSAEGLLRLQNLTSGSSDFSHQQIINSVPGSLSSTSYSAHPLHQISNLSLSSTNTNYPISSISVHPPIMSTKEQSTTTLPNRSPSPSVIPASFNNLANLGHSGIIYRPAYYHWFLRIETKDGKELWQPFSMTDSLALEQALNSDTLTVDTVIPTDGGRYDVNITNRTRTAVYWDEEPKRVMRCSWFYKSTTESRLHPYDENTAYNLEEEYKKAVTTNTWNKKVDLPSGDYVIMYGPSSIALFQCTPQSSEGWEAETDFTDNFSHRPKIVKRGILDDFEIDDGESATIDHLIFVVHGIGSVCDFKFRTIEEAEDVRLWSDLSQLLFDKVDGFRNKSLQLIKSHFRTSFEKGLVSRIEVLPVSWHGHLHGEATGVDKKLQTITLKSIPRLRHFTNDTLLDILFYTSPVYCETIMQQVGNEINGLYDRFLSRNPSFKGGVSLVGHSLGSLILFDMLCHQKPIVPRADSFKKQANTNIVSQEVLSTVSGEAKRPSLRHKVSYVVGRAGTGQPYVEYPQLNFQPLAFFAMGSPIGMFVTVRGIDSLGIDFFLPTCPKFFNIFHPFDPVAYRIEALINPELSEKRPVLIPHHKGRKRMHLELKETMARVGADLKQRLIDSVRSTWNTVYQLTLFGRADDGLEQEVDKVIEKQLERQQTDTAVQCLNETCYETDCDAGKLNQGRRIDYVLQEAPLESFNEYVSALISHVIYWDSEDTMLLILKEIYGSMNILPDNQLNNVSGSSGGGGGSNTPGSNNGQQEDSVVSPSVTTTMTLQMPLS